MPLDSGDRRNTKPRQEGGAPAPEPEHFPCPRCASTNTKFCYYNNYNSSQPRHFCKSCRRYWTRGGTLRDIPFGGSNRKNAKRSRTTTPSISATSTQDYRHLLTTATSPIFVPLAADHGGSVPFVGDGKPNLNMRGSFTSLLNTTQGPGLLTLGRFGLGVGIGPRFDDMGFGLGRPVWPFSGFGDDGTGASMNGNTWQVQSGEDGFVSGDCFSLPDIAISTPGNSMK